VGGPGGLPVQRSRETPIFLYLRFGRHVVNLTSGQRLRLWWNWQTRYFEVVVAKAVQVQVLLSAPVFPLQAGETHDICTEFAQNSARTADRRVMKFPVTIRHRASKAKIYAPGGKFAYYRLAYTVAGKRKMQTFTAYADARQAGERLVRDLANGSQAAGFSASQSRDALAAMQRLDAFRQSTGKRFSLLGAVSEFCEAAGKLNGRTVADAVAGYLSTIAAVKRVDLAKAVDEFLEAQAPLTKSAKGHRAQLSGKYAYNRKIQLARFAGTFPNTAVCELAKEHVDSFMAALSDLSPKSRNHYRAAVRQFLQWAVRKDYLTITHRLGEADGLRRELADNGEIEFYTTNEFRALLETAEGPMRAMVAIGGLAGLRSAEILRLTWQDVFHVPGHIEITAGKSKTRQRRLVEVCPALAAWLDPFRQKMGNVCPITAKSVDVIWQQQFLALCDRAGVSRKRNGLRHSFCSFHFAAYQNENLTAAQAGNSPAMIHGHYKGLATKAEAEKWFAVAPAKADNVITLTPKESIA
jgi:integrase